MTQEDKELLLKDLCARLPYGVKVMKQYKSETRTLASIDVVNFRVRFLENDVNSPFGVDIENPIEFFQQIKPYLRTMLSMTEEEKKEFESLGWRVDELNDNAPWNHNSYNEFDGIDWLNKKMFDYHGLIPMGLALEAKEGMYN